MTALLIGLALMCAMCVIFGIVYPAVYVAYEKIVRHSRKSVSQLWDEC